MLHSIWTSTNVWPTRRFTRIVVSLGDWGLIASSRLARIIWNWLLHAIDSFWHRCVRCTFDVQSEPRSWLAAAPSLLVCWALCAVASLLLFAWMRTAILAGGIAVVRSGVWLCREWWHGDILCSQATGLQARQRMEQKKALGNLEVVLLNFTRVIASFRTTYKQQLSKPETESFFSCLLSDWLWHVTSLYGCSICSYLSSHDSDAKWKHVLISVTTEMFGSC